ncbi:MAG: DNA-directed RNA polymerase subunit F [Candidatus Hydrothermarchaeales archaeon]
MIGKRMVEETPMAKANVGEILKKREKEVEELLYEQRLTLEHIRKFSKVKVKAARELVEELLKINDKIKRRHAIKVADLLPKDEGDVKAIFAKERFALTKDEIKEILGVVSKYS